MALFQTRIVGATDPGAGLNYNVTRDGRFLINTVVDAATSPITLVQNWKPPGEVVAVQVPSARRTKIQRFRNVERNNDEMRISRWSTVRFGLDIG